MPPLIWFGGVMLPAGWLVLESLRASEGHMSLAVLGLELAVAYVIASLPSGWRVLQVFGAEEGEDIAMALLWALVLGPVVAPFSPAIRNRQVSEGLVPRQAVKPTRHHR